jgi:hypothetical protein
MDNRPDINELVRTKRFNRYELKTKIISNIEFMAQSAYGYETNDIIRLYMTDNTVYEFVSRPGTMDKPSYYEPSTYIDVWKYAKKEEPEIVPPVDIDEVIDNLKKSVKEQETKEPVTININMFRKLFEIDSKEEENDIIKLAKLKGLKIILTKKVAQFSL